MNEAAGRGGARVIEVLGLGMGAAPGRAGMERIIGADVLAGGARLLARFAHLPGGRVVLASPLDEALDSIAKARDQGLRVVVLADGDPLFYGIGARLVERFGASALRFTPGVSAVQAACSRIGLPWNDLRTVSLHGRADCAPLLAALAAEGRAAVYTDNRNTPDSVARLLLEQGLDNAALWVLEDLGSPEERVRRLNAAEAAGEEFSPLNLVIVETGEPGQPPMLGRPDEFYAARDGLITKWPVRSCALAALRLPRDGVLWDVGAGSGAVGLEACALMPLGMVFAVERDPERHRLIRENIRRSRAWQVRAVEGQAPEALAGLPDPDRVFLGGSLAGGSGTLAEACRRLKPGGRIVADTVLLGSLNLAVEHFRSLGWPSQTLQIQSSQCVPLAGDQHLVAHNPVFIITADKPTRA